MQLLLFPDPRPLVERLGAEFFRTAPIDPGVYLMRGADGTVLYVGKAKNLRKRLGNYRVANPQRLRRRHLRLLGAVRKIDLEICADEAGALAREAELLLELRPRFNRAGTWKGPTRFVCWRWDERGIDLELDEMERSGWNCHGPMGSGAVWLRARLALWLWCALRREAGAVGMPAGWFAGRLPAQVRIETSAGRQEDMDLLGSHLHQFFGGEPEGLIGWLTARAAPEGFEGAMWREELEAIIK